MKIRSRGRWRKASWSSLAASLAVGAWAATPSTQQAVVKTANGGPEVLQVQSIPVLAPGADQVLIRVFAAAVNPVDWKMRAGMARTGPPGAAPGAAPGAPPGAPPGGPPGGMGGGGPSILGLDVAGVVEKLGPGVTRLKAGDKVFSMIGRGGVSGLNGGYAQFVVAPAANVLAKPVHYTFAQAAGLGTAGMTGMRAVTQTQVVKGQRVLITGVAGGVGSAAAQIARARGAHVIGTASPRHAVYLQSIGVAQVIDYTAGNFEDQVKNVDVVIDTVGGDTTERALATVRRGGTLLSVAGRVAPEKCAAAGVTCLGGGPPGAGGASEGEMLAAVAKLASEGKYRVSIDKSFPLEKAADAQVYGAQGHTQGKIILVVDAARAEQR